MLLRRGQRRVASATESTAPGRSRATTRSRSGPRARPLPASDDRRSAGDSRRRQIPMRWVTHRACAGGRVGGEQQALGFSVYRRPQVQVSECSGRSIGEHGIADLDGILRTQFALSLSASHCGQNLSDRQLRDHETSTASQESVEHLALGRGCGCGCVDLSQGAGIDVGTSVHARRFCLACLSLARLGRERSLHYRHLAAKGCMAVETACLPRRDGEVRAVRRACRGL